MVSPYLIIGAVSILLLSVIPTILLWSSRNKQKSLSTSTPQLPGVSKVVEHPNNEYKQSKQSDHEAKELRSLETETIKPLEKDPQNQINLTPSQVYEQVKGSVVIVKVYNRQRKLVGQGSGVMLPSHDIITNFHVVEGGALCTVGCGRKNYLATLKAIDPKRDLCLLTCPELVAKPARLGKAAKLKVRDPVYAVGAPLGLELSLSEGIGSQLRWGSPYPIIQTTVAISPGSSGGGLFNAKGELVGITTFFVKGGQSLNFALPVEWIGQVPALPKDWHWEDPAILKDWEKPALPEIQWEKPTLPKGSSK